LSSRLFPIFLIFIVLFAYLYFSLVGFFEQSIFLRSFQLVFALALGLVFYSLSSLDRKIRERTLFHGSGINFHIGVLISLLITSLIFCVFMLFYDLSRGIISIFRSAGLPRSEYIVVAISITALIAFLIMIYGMTIGRYNYKIERLNLSFNNLPTSFDGLKLVHISDIHAGSYDNNKGLSKGIRLINKEEPDLILFTGDIVNDHKDEVQPYIEDINQLKSKYGTYAVLGNHDYYGAYRQQNKVAYWDDFFLKFEQMNMTLLNNQHAIINNGKESIAIVGSENWGNANWTPKRGDLRSAFNGLSKSQFSILLTHDPSHWDHQVLNLNRHVPLTLSGHTHGFQFGINLSFFKWSPAKYRYPKWMGLYEQTDQYLYVNRGFGFLAFPGRVGMRPEITVITLNAMK